MDSLGITIAVCCYNSAARLPRTLKHLASQYVPESISWEVIVINNGSTDDTVRIARACWPANPPAALRIVNEPRVGQSYARLKAFDEAAFDIVSFVDDDNWVAPDFLAKVHALMSEHPRVGALGGLNTAASDVPFPKWFSEAQHSYAVGPQSSIVGDVTETKPRLYGAGLSIRKRAFQKLCAEGFQFILPGREAKALTASEDYELCFALALAGWRIWYDPSIQLQHYLPSDRLDWTYLRRLSRSTSRSGVLLDPYLFAIGKRDAVHIHPLLRSWSAKVIASSCRLFLRCWLLPFTWGSEGSRNVLTVECLLGRLWGLFSWRSLYVAQIKSVARSPWRAGSVQETSIPPRDAKVIVECGLTK